MIDRSSMHVRDRQCMGGGCKTRQRKMDKFKFASCMFSASQGERDKRELQGGEAPAESAMSTGSWLPQSFVSLSVGLSVN
mmetsp:Transcript_55106/g.107775  ORF Transcript_55106/g.107775 Transcript_55106/m.107775 type:complete len:80 (+) Transcript_55106:1217-1456(+)